MKNEEYKYAYKKMTSYLGVRDHSLKELHTKLSKHFDGETVNSVIEKAIENNWISSPQDMATETKNRLDSKRKGFLYIQQYLQQKGLPEIIKDEEIEIEKACAIISQHFKDIEKLTDEQKHKAMRLLQNRGFDSETINKVTYEIY